MPDKVYTTGQAARLLGVEDQTVRKWCRLGKIDAYTTSSPGGHWRITRAVLVEYAHKNGKTLPEEGSND